MQSHVQKCRRHEDALHSDKAQLHEQSNHSWLVGTVPYRDNMPVAWATTQIQQHLITEARWINPPAICRGVNSPSDGQYLCPAPLVHSNWLFAGMVFVWFLKGKMDQDRSLHASVRLHCSKLIMSPITRITPVLPTNTLKAQYSLMPLRNAVGT